MSNFWSKRKAAVEAEQALDIRAEEAKEEAAHELELAEKSDEEILEELGLPDPDTLVEGDDFKAFLTKAVPARIRTRAIRRLWLSNPVLANVDGLVDYGEDFTDAACVLENMQTSYQVGKGMARHVEEMARQAETEAEQHDIEEEAAEAADAPLAESEDDTPIVLPEMDADQPAPSVDGLAFDDTADIPETPRRRMRFAFDQQGESE